MKTITIGFSRPVNLTWKPYARLIMWAFSTPYDHTYLKFHSESCQRDIIYQASGSQINFMGSSYFEKNNIVVKEFEIQIEEEDYQHMLQFCIDNAGLPYGVLLAFGDIIVTVASWCKMAINNPFPGEDVCSSLMAKILNSFTKIKIEGPTENVTPKVVYTRLANLYA